VPASEFSYEGAKNRLVSKLDLTIDDAPKIAFTTPGDEFGGGSYAPGTDGLGRQGRLMRLAGWIDLDSKLTVSLSNT
jgi:DNA mismatch repair protein MSH5